MNNPIDLVPPPNLRRIDYDGPWDARNYELVKRIGETTPVRADVRDLVLVGHRQKMTNPAGEWGHGIYTANVDGGEIDNVWIYDCHGDGICLGSSLPNDGDAIIGASKGVSIKQSVIVRARRCGIAFIGAENIRVEDVTIRDCGGVVPNCGIDFEPDRKSPWNRNIVLRRVSISGGPIGIIADKGGPMTRDVLIDQCRFHGTEWSAWFDFPPGHNIGVRNCRFDGPIAVWRGITDMGGNTFSHSPYR